MTPYYSDDWLTVYQGDCRAVMAAMEPESINCVVTSPPYWGLRDYGTASWEGGDPACDHRAPAGGTRNKGRDRAASGGTFHDSPRVEPALGLPYREACPCGAARVDAQLGLEPTPEEYVANMVAVFREVRRVLRSDGTVWLNLGDSYWNHSPVRSASAEGWEKEWSGGLISEGPTQRRRANGHESLKMKDLVGIPWRVAFALQADGWYLRSDIIWAKPNPMPESVTDRPTKAHEYLFLLSKSPRYYYDADAVREPLSESTVRIHGSVGVRAKGNGSWKNERNADRNDGTSDTLANGRESLARMQAAGGRNLRSVWTVATQPYPGAHFATFPPKLVEPCIKAGTSERGVCPECGAPWVRESEKGPQRSANGGLGTRSVTTLGWRPSCDCVDVIRGGETDEPREVPCTPVPAIVLDPFAGSGTTGMVAQPLGRRAVLIDLNGEYLTQAMARNRDVPLGLPA